MLDYVDEKAHMGCGDADVPWTGRNLGSSNLAPVPRDWKPIATGFGPDPSRSTNCAAGSSTHTEVVTTPRHACPKNKDCLRNPFFYLSFLLIC